MKRLLLYSNLGLVMLLVNLSCGPIATFDTPQPNGLKNESGFGKNIQGVYQSADSSSILRVNEKFIIHEYTEILLETDSLTLADTNSTAIDNSKADTVHNQIIKLDTIFKIDEAHALKKYRGHYFLNWKSSETQKWEVSKLSLEKDLLTIASIRGEEDINKLNEITKTPQDTTVGSVNYDLNKKQFKEFLKSNGFSAIDSFRRVIR